MKIDLRKPTEMDLLRFKECLSHDPDHSAQDPDSWAMGPAEFYVFHDGRGNRVWVRMERVLRISLQHDQDSPKIAIAGILDKGLHWLVGAARQKGYEEIIFESRAERLIQFFKKRFGFEPLKENFYVRTIRGAEDALERTSQLLQ
jgi:hypothetical protein